MRKAATSPLGSLLGFFRRPRVGPTQTAGTGGTQVVGGYIVSVEKDSSLLGLKKYERFADILTNVSIVGAAVRNFLNLVSSVRWKYEPADGSGAQGEEIALQVEQILDDMTTPWHRVVRKAAMFKFHGFSMQEWTAKKRDDGSIGFLDIEARPCFTIERWDVDEGGTINGVLQRSPQTGQELYIPRAKLLYMVDDSLKDSPEGLGIFRHLIEPAKRLQRYEQLEGFGFETDLKGIPLGRAPLGALAQALKSGAITTDEQRAYLAPIEAFLETHIKTPQTALMLDSDTYRTLDESASPSAVKKWDLELLQGQGTSDASVAVGAAVSRVIREIARLLGSEHLLLGEMGGGSHAMHKDKTSQFSQMVDSAVIEIVEAIEADILPVLFELNGWPPELFPTIKATSVAQRDVAEMTGALASLAQAGATMSPDEEAIGEIFDMMGLTRPTKMLGAQDLALIASAAAPAPGDQPGAAASGAAAAKKPEQKVTPTQKWHSGRGRFQKRFK